MCELNNEFWYRIHDEKNIDELSNILGVRQNEILRNNDDLPLYAGEMVKIKMQCDAEDVVDYIVKPMDTLDAVSLKFGVDKENIITENNLKTEKLFIGQKLKIKK